MQISGKLLEVTSPTNGTSKAGKDWVKSHAIIEVGESYPKKVSCIIMKEDLIMQMASKRIGDVVSVEVNPESREYNGNWMTDLKVWKING